MAKVGVNGAANNFATDLSKVLSFIGELDDFGWTYKCEVEWVEKQQQVFVLEVMKGHFLETFCWTVPGLHFEKGSYFSHCGFDCCCCHI